MGSQCSNLSCCDNNSKVQNIVFEEDHIKLNTLEGYAFIKSNDEVVVDQVKLEKTLKEEEKNINDEAIKQIKTLPMKRESRSLTTSNVHIPITSYKTEDFAINKDIKAYINNYHERFLNRVISKTVKPSEDNELEPVSLNKLKIAII